MTINKIHRLLDEGAVLNIKASGVTFVCLNNPKMHRQEAIKLMKVGVELEDRMLDIVSEPNNKYDEYALRLDFEGNDVGYIPKNVDVNITTIKGRNRRSYSKNINKILCEYTSELSCEIEGIYGGYNGKHLGFTVNIWKT